MTYWSYDAVKEIDWITGCSLLIRKDPIKKIGFLDERYFMYTEECDLSYQMRKDQWKTVFYPYASIIHFGGQSSLTRKDQTVHSSTITKYLFDSRYYFFKKNYGRWKEIILRNLDLLYYGSVYIKNKIMFAKKNREEMMNLAKSALQAALNK
jgi:GT2 family glycosyltransferase